MPELNTRVCDQCGNIKRDANHWWVLWANKQTKSLYIAPIENEKLEMLPGNLYIRLFACGLQCLDILEQRIKQGK